MTSRVLVSLRVRASPERAFDVFTKDIGLWWRANDLFEFTPGQSGTLSFEPGLGGKLVQTGSDGRIFEIGRVTAWERGVRLGFTWRQASFAPDQVTEVDVRFEPVGEETRVTVEHSGWDRIPQDHVARHRFPDQVFLLRHAEWWRAQLERMGKSATP